MRNRLIAFAIVFALLFGLLVLGTHPKRFVDWLFYAAAVCVIVFALFGSSGAFRGRGMGSLGLLPRKQRRFQDRPDHYDYPDSRR